MIVWPCPSPSTLLRLIVGVATALLICGPSTAQSGHGAMGPESRSTIRISVSVMPSFHIRTDGEGENRVSSASNAPAIRYTIVEAPVVPSEAQIRSGDPPPQADELALERAAMGMRVIMIVPD